MDKNHNTKKILFKNRFVLLGFGCVGQALMPLIFEKFDIKPSQVTIIADEGARVEVAQQYGVSFKLQQITPQNYLEVIGGTLEENDFLIDVSIGISSLALIILCNQKGALYINAATEPWKEEFVMEKMALNRRTNYSLCEEVLHLKDKTQKTALITHGANPGLVSHFIKEALLNIAKDNGLTINRPKNAAEWANLAMTLGIKVIHVAEQDSQVTYPPKSPGEFVNTWSANGLILEGLQPAEIGWGTHEAHWPHDAYSHSNGPQCAIYLSRPSAGVMVRSWTPTLGAFHGFLITHAETISLTNFLTLKNGSELLYRPTVHYAYNPCPDARLSIFELKSNEWKPQNKNRLILNEIIDGCDELGVLLMGNQRGAYWYGSTLSIQEARQIAPYNNATSLQVVASMISGIIWAIEHPDEGIVEPEEVDHQYIIDIAKPYLGKVGGYYTDWTPLKNRGELYPEEVDLSDPWQFFNIRVS
ncbi:TPA: homospermidine synthase [Legionella pneumophila]|nr:homospermidine synthase [Legionella pneumophila]HEI6748996.1 homospermidine synthase [Legionella pneumophila]